MKAEHRAHSQSAEPTRGTRRNVGNRIIHSRIRLVCKNRLFALGLACITTVHTQFAGPNQTKESAEVQTSVFRVSTRVHEVQAAISGSTCPHCYRDIDRPQRL